MREHQLAAGDDVLQPGATITERARGEVAPIAVQQVEGHKQRRGATASGSGSRSQSNRDLSSWS
jgi:hypothetical protein